MASEHDRPPKLAILIDADNASPRILKELFEAVTSIGEASVRRIYGDFSNGRLKGWSEVLTAYGIVPHQNFATTTGKNASDIALVIDAMDLLHTGRFDGFCLVSSDSDFTRLAARIREQGIDVYGFGERKTPDSFQKACKRFICTEHLTPAHEREDVPVLAKKAPAPGSSSPQKSAEAVVSHIKTALGELEDMDGWYSLGALGTRLHARMPEFDPRTYGCSKLVTLVEQTGIFDIRRVDLTVYVGLKDVIARAHHGRMSHDVGL